MYSNFGIRIPILIFSCPTGTLSPVSRFRASSMSPADERAHMPVVQAEESKRPRKVLQVGEQLVNKDAVSDSPSNIIQNMSSGPASLAIVEEGDGFQDAEVMRQSLFASRGAI
jgi:hypothetical protein